MIHNSRNNRNRKFTGSRMKLSIGCWNVRTLLDLERSSRPEWRTVLVTNEWQRLNIDIAALSETRLSGEDQVTEVGLGYTLFWKGKPGGGMVALVSRSGPFSLTGLSIQLESLIVSWSSESLWHVVGACQFCRCMHQLWNPLRKASCPFVRLFEVLLQPYQLKRSWLSFVISACELVRNMMYGMPLAAMTLAKLTVMVYFYCSFVQNLILCPMCSSVKSASIRSHGHPPLIKVWTHDRLYTNT